MESGREVLSKTLDPERRSSKVVSEENMRTQEEGSSKRLEKSREMRSVIVHSASKYEYQENSWE